jgi:hypothetical protein
MLAGIGSMQADVPPQMIEIDACRRDAILQENRSIAPMSAASGQGPRSSRQQEARFFRLSGDVAEHLEVPYLGHRRFEADALGLKEGVEAHDAEAHAAFARGGYLARAISSGARSM